MIRVIRNFKWYREHGYFASLYLPKILDIEQEQISSEEEVRGAIVAEYDQLLYDAAAQEITRSWSEVDERVTAALRTNGLATTEEHVVRLTRYGTGGSYHLPNIIVVNFAKMRATVPALVHEMIHLSTERHIKRHGVDQQQKERLIELITKKIVPDMILQRQTSGHPEVEKAFGEYFPDLDAIVSHIK